MFFKVYVLCVGMQAYQSQWNNAMQWQLCRSRSFKVTDFGTNQKLIYDFLLVINPNWTQQLANAVVTSEIRLK